MVKKIFEYIDLAVLSEALLYGCLSEDIMAGSETYEQRLKNAEDALLEQLKGLHMDSKLDDDVQDIIYQHLIRVNPIYFELGMKAGVAFYRKLQGELPAKVQASVEQAYCQSVTSKTIS